MKPPPRHVLDVDSLTAMDQLSFHLTSKADAGLEDPQALLVFLDKPWLGAQRSKSEFNGKSLRGFVVDNYWPQTTVVAAAKQLLQADTLSPVAAKKAAFLLEISYNRHYIGSPQNQLPVATLASLATLAHTHRHELQMSGDVVPNFLVSPPEAAASTALDETHASGFAKATASLAGKDIRLLRPLAAHGLERLQETAAGPKTAQTRKTALAQIQFLHHLLRDAGDSKIMTLDQVSAIQHACIAVGLPERRSDFTHIARTAPETLDKLPTGRNKGENHR